MTNPTEINRWLATEVMGREWVEIPKDNEIFFCSYCACKIVKEHDPNPDYLTNLSDRQDLLEACVKEEWWSDFLGRMLLQRINFETLLIPKEALATAIYRYLKGRER